MSLGLGLAGALVGYVIFTLGLGIGDTDIFDWGGLLSALIGTLIVLGLAGYLLRRPPTRPTPSTRPPGNDGPRRGRELEPVRIQLVLDRTQPDQASDAGQLTALPGRSTPPRDHRGHVVRDVGICHQIAAG